MSGYLVLARKYRSRTFEEVIGQEVISQTLLSAIKTGRIHHAYLFTGTRGVGKTTMARILAKALNCLKADAPTPKPCNKCDACVAISRGDDMDVVEIDGASNRGIDEIRELRANAIFSPARCRYRIYYIDEVHMLTKEAFNALLKTLEEPPEHVKFIFATTEAEKVPATILSRCQRFDFRNIPTRQIAEHLRHICKSEKVSADEDALFRLARAGAGSMRDALSLLDQLLAAGEHVTDGDVIRVLGTPPDERMVALALAIADGSAASALGELDGVLESGVSLASATAGLGDVFRNMMIAATCGADSELIELPEAQRKAVGELAGRFSTPVLVQALGICQTAARNARGSSVARALVEAAIVRLAESDKFVDPSSLIERLEAISGGGAAGPGEKKKSIALPAPGGGAKEPAPAAAPARGTPAAARPATRPAHRPAPAAAAAPAARELGPPAEIRWESAYLRTHWQDVTEHLAAAGKMQEAGALRPAEVLALDGEVLTLGFAPEHEALLARCSGPLAGRAAEALSKLAGRTVRCRYVATGREPNEANGVGELTRARASLNTAERNEIVRDATVKAVTDLFGGEVVDIRLGPVAAEPSADEGGSGVEAESDESYEAGDEEG